MVGGGEVLRIIIERGALKSWSPWYLTPRPTIPCQASVPRRPWRECILPRSTMAWGGVEGGDGGVNRVWLGYP